MKKQPWEMTKEQFAARQYGDVDVDDLRGIEVKHSPEYEAADAEKDAAFRSLANASISHYADERTRSRYGTLTKAKAKIVKNFDKAMRTFLDAGTADRDSVQSQLHKGVIEKALSEGKPVPPEVLKDYPELVKSDNKKEPWQMTNAEFSDSFRNPASYEWYKDFGWPEGYTYNQNSEYRRLTGHHGIVKTAIDKGLPVPSNVLADYPDLVGKTKGFLSRPYEEDTLRDDKISPDENAAIHAYYDENPDKDKFAKRKRKIKSTAKPRPTTSLGSMRR